MTNTNDLVIDIGTSFSVVLYVTDADGLPMDLTGYTATGDMRKHPRSSKSIPFVCSINSPTDGVVGISLTAAATADAQEGAYVYSVKCSNESGSVIKVSGGIVSLKP